MFRLSTPSRSRRPSVATPALQLRPPPRLELGHERRHVNGERLPQPFEVEEADIASTAFDIADIARMEARSFGERFLGQSTSEPQGPDSMAESDE